MVGRFSQFVNLFISRIGEDRGVFDNKDKGTAPLVITEGCSNQKPSELQKWQKTRELKRFWEDKLLVQGLRLVLQTDHPKLQGCNRSYKQIINMKYDSVFIKLHSSPETGEN